MDNTDEKWTIQEFATVAGKPWFVLQKETDVGIERRFTGWRAELDIVAVTIGITPQLLPPTTEQEFLRRDSGEPPDRKSLIRALARYPEPGG